MRSKPLEDLPSIPQIEGGEMWQGINTLSLQEGAEYASLMGVLGLFFDDINLQNKTLEHAEWLATLLDHRDFPFYSLWSSGGKCDLTSILAFNHVLFTLCECLTKDAKWQRLADAQLRYLERTIVQNSIDLPLLPPLLYSLVIERGSVLSFCTDSSVKPPPLFLCGQSENSSFVCSLSGRNSGMGAFHKDSVKVVNFGPWAAPLGEFSGFGIKRGMSEFCESSASSLQGWTRMQPSAHFPDTWSRVDVKNEEGKLNLSIAPTPVADAGTLSFAFLVQSEQAQIGNHRFLPATMRHYVGESSLITFYSGKEKIEISTCERREVELIPLAGGGHFWGANFLLAFTLYPNNPALSCSVC